LDWTNFLSFVPATNRSVSNSVQVRITATAPVTNALEGNISVASIGALSGTNTSLLGVVLPDTSIPAITASTNALSGLGSVEGSPGSSTNFAVSGTFLRGPITVSATNSFIAVSTNNLDFGSAVSIPRDDNNQVLSNAVYVRITEFAPASTSTNVFLGNLVLGTTRNSNNLPAATNVAVSGTVTNWSIANPYGLRVTNPANPVTTNATNFTFRGQIGTGLAASSLSWSNFTRGQGGVFSPGTNLTWMATNLPLLEGANSFVFSGQFQTNAGPTNVTDTPLNDAYGAWNSPSSTNWLNGSGGSAGGFGPWALTSNGVGVYWRANRTTVTNLNVVPDYVGFAMASDSTGQARAYRAFGETLQAPGGSFSVYFDNNSVADFAGVGMHLVATNGSNRTPIFTFAAVNEGSGTFYQITDRSSNAYTPPGWMPATRAGLILNFEMTSSNAYRFTATRLDNTNVSSSVTNLIVADLPIAGVEFFSAFNGSSTTNQAFNFYIGEMTQSRMQFASATVSAFAPTVVRSNAPTSAYNAWAQSFGLNPAGNGAPGADPDNDGFVNDMEYAFGTSPIAPNATVLTASSSGTNMVGTFIARLSGVTYTVQEKVNLAATMPGWATATNGITGPTRSTNQVGVLDTNNYERRTFSVPAVGNDFFRIRATISN
jgi:hypothetical protein